MAWFSLLPPDFSFIEDWIVRIFVTLSQIIVLVSRLTVSAAITGVLDHCTLGVPYHLRLLILSLAFNNA